MFDPEYTSYDVVLRFEFKSKCDWCNFAMLLFRFNQVKTTRMNICNQRKVYGSNGMKDLVVPFQGSLLRLYRRQLEPFDAQVIARDSFWSCKK